MSVFLLKNKNEYQKKQESEQEQAVLDAQELAIENDEQTLDLTELVMCLSEENEALKKRIENLEIGREE